jgi:[acyl-carrier-protein] S-malonyltransferase
MTTAYIFPGQGSQSIGMLAELATEHAIIKETYQEASDVLGYDLWSIVENGPADKLNETQITQPALLSAGVAVWRLLQAQQVNSPNVLAGHSLGEYTALVCGGALEFVDAIGLVAERGRLMQEAVPAGVGAMAAILGLEDDQVSQICQQLSQDGDVVACANYNSPGQIVIAGHLKAVESALVALKEAGAKRSVLLPVSVPSHCALMQPAAEALRLKLDSITLKLPAIPVLHNVDAQTRDSADAIKIALIEQLYQPVRWVDVMQAIQKGSDQVIECGPGKVLTGLCKRISRDIVCTPVFDLASLEKVSG